MLDVGKLTLLREVATHGGITSAAEALEMSPSNVSQQLRRLERAYGVALLEPRGRGISLTPAAERLVRRTEDVLEILEAAETELVSSRDIATRTVRLVGFHTFAVGLLGSMVTRLAALAPELSLEFTQLEPEASIDAVLTRRADVAVIDEYEGFPLEPAPGIVRIVLGEEPVRAYLPAGAMSAADADWAMEPETSDSAKWTRSVCRTAGFEPRARYVSPDPYVHRRLLEQGIAAAFLPATVAADLPADVRVADELPAILHRTHTLIMRRGAHRSAANEACRVAIAAALADAVRENRAPASHDTVYPPSAGSTAPVM